MNRIFTILLAFSFSQTSHSQPQDTNCPNNFKEIEVLISQYSQKSNQLWLSDKKLSQTYSNAADSLEGFLQSLNYGTRDDLGESAFISYVVLDDAEIKAIINNIQKKIAVLKKSPETQEAALLIESAIQKLPKINLILEKLDINKLKCLGGTDYINLIEQQLREGSPSLFETEIKNYKLNSNKAWSDAIENLVKNEETLWSDTILEGEIGQNGPAEASSVRVVMHENTRLLTQVTITAPAVYTGNDDCEYSEEQNKWIGEECYEGSIYVTKFLNFLDQPIGSMNFAEFD